MQNRAEQLFPIFQYYPKFMCKSFDESNEKIRNIVKEKIENRRRNLHLNENVSYLLDAILVAQDIYKLTEEEILDEMVTWVMGGHETTSSLLSWTLYLLDKHPNVQQKID